MRSNSYGKKIGKPRGLKMIPTYVLTNDNHLWLLRGFCHLWEKYCDKLITIAGFSFPSFILSSNCRLQSLGEQLPASQWSDSLLKLLDNIPYRYFILMLEDYWLYDYVDMNKISNLQGLMADDVLRIDLSGNRASYKAAKEIEPGIVETPEGTPYQMSFQAAIWHKENLRKVLKKGESPWESEVNGTKRVGNLRVLGTKPALLRYQPVWRSKQQKWQLEKIKTVDLEYMKVQGWLDAPT